MTNSCTHSVTPAPRGLLDRLAIGMAVVCGIHCLVTPVLLVALPIIGTTFWVDQNFHLWMLFLVLPTTGLALMSGCRRHKDRWVMAAGATGLVILLCAFAAERIAYSRSTGFSESVAAYAAPVSSLNESSATEPHVAGGGCCALHPAASDSAGVQSAAPVGGITRHALLNALGGLFLVVGHSRNFVLCRKSACRHETRK